MLHFCCLMQWSQFGRRNKCIKRCKEKSFKEMLIVGCRKIKYFGGSLEEHVLMCRCVHAQERPKEASFFFNFWLTLRLTSWKWRLRQGCKWSKCGNHVSANISAKVVRFYWIRVFKKVSVQSSANQQATKQWVRQFQITKNTDLKELVKEIH